MRLQTKCTVCISILALVLLFHVITAHAVSLKIRRHADVSDKYDHNYINSIIQ